MNVFDYLQWRGDLTFSADGLNEVDALIFSWVSYYKLENFRDSGIDVKNLTFEEIRKTHIDFFGEFEKRDISTMVAEDSAEYLFSVVSETERFKNVKIVDFEEIFSVKDTIQFAAVTFLLGDKTSVVAYRGTDTSIVGWKEDCQLSYKNEISGQKAALEYIEKTPKTKTIFLCGHSKGGNLALYALYNTKKSNLKKVKRTYNFDGPGFLSGDLKNGRDLDSIVKSFVPESSIVGMLLDHTYNYTVVESKMVSVLQHNAMMWQVVGTHFVCKDDTSFSSKVADETFALWLKELSLEDREEFVETLFSIFEKTDLKNITDIGDGFFSNLQNIISGFKGISRDKAKMLVHVIKEFARIFGKSVISTHFSFHS